MLPELIVPTRGRHSFFSVFSLNCVRKFVELLVGLSRFKFCLLSRVFKLFLILLVFCSLICSFLPILVQIFVDFKETTVNLTWRISVDYWRNLESRVCPNMFQQIQSLRLWWENPVTILVGKLVESVDQDVFQPKHNWPKYKFPF